MSVVSECGVCHRLVSDGQVCYACAEKVASSMHSAACLWEALQDQLAKQNRDGERLPRVGKLAPSQPQRPGMGDPAQDQQDGYPSGLVVDLGAAEVSCYVDSVVSKWTLYVSSEVGADAPFGVVNRLRWLASRTQWMRYYVWSTAALSELDELNRIIMRTVDRGRDATRFLGPCGMPGERTSSCTGTVRAAAGDTVAYCPVCGTGHSVLRRRHWLAGLVANRHYPAADLASAYGLPAGTIRQWAHRGKLAVRGRDAMGRPLYRAGDVLALTKTRTKGNAQ